MRSLPPYRRSSFLGALLVPAAIALAGCSSAYFHGADAPREPVRFRLADLSHREIWSGIVFNGEKVGFSRLEIAPAGEPGTFELRSEAALRFRMLGLDKSLMLKSRDVVREDLGLISFEHEQSVDGSLLVLRGTAEGRRLHVKVANAGQELEDTVTADPRVRPASAMNLVPVIEGLQVGARYAYPVFNAETRRIEQAEQRVEGFERSDLFDGPAFRLVSRLMGVESTTWIDPGGRPVLETAMGGVLIAALEDEGRARQYLAEASLSKREGLLEFSLVRPDAQIDSPARLSRLRAAVSAGDRNLSVPSSDYQRCGKADGEWICEISRPSPGAALRGRGPASADPRHLRPSLAVPSTHPSISRLAREIAGRSLDARETVSRLLDWIRANILQRPADVISALDVLEKRAAECQGHSYLLAALARSLGIPSRLANGLVYAREQGAFAYHTWVEVYLDAEWTPVDPTFGQLYADATHIKLVEGEEAAETLALTDWIGRTRLRILRTEYSD